MSLTSAEIEKLIPHAGSMSLLDRAVEWNEQTLRCSATSHQDPDNPLRANERLSSICGLEYAAQGIALHGALVDEGNAGRPGLLIALREVRFMTQRLDDIPHDLIIDVEKLIADDSVFNYRFRISTEGKELLGGKATVFLKEEMTE